MSCDNSVSAYAQKTLPFPPGARERGKRLTASVAENRAASDAKEAIYEEVRM